MSETAQRALRVAAILFFLSLVVFAKFHEPTRFAHTLQKLGHPVAFGAVALLFLTLLRRQTPRRFGCYVVAFALTIVCGAGTEVAQAFVNRETSLFDVLRDALGASAALAGFATIIPGADARGWRGMGGARLHRSADLDLPRGLCASGPPFPDGARGVLAARSLFPG